MPEINDYSGPFKPDLRWEDFSKDLIAEYAREMSRIYVLVGGICFGYLRERFGPQRADELHLEFWESLGNKHEFNRPRASMGICGRDVKSFLKFTQIDPGIGMIFDIDCELKDQNHGILTINNCTALSFFERKGDTQAQENGCCIDVWSMTKVVRVLDPDLVAIPMKLPPRKGPDEPACIWEIKKDPTRPSLAHSGLPEYAREAAAKADWNWPLYP
ncbi:hypothetical protein ACFLX5_01060 [Chloroflexota bacterium]